ncbi:MAG: Preprotein translocase subunit SecE [Oscillospiraceae bacterium]|jgi:preprotein translocase subunit SecE|nr:Preprotein translocase subunit SecE [Oscillospiraceae bacterium]
MAEKPEKKSIFARFSKFFRDQKSEVKKIVWPSKKQVLNNTGIVLIAVTLFAIMTGGFDWILGMIVKTVLGA